LGIFIFFYDAQEYLKAFANGTKNQQNISVCFCHFLSTINIILGIRMPCVL